MERNVIPAAAQAEQSADVAIALSDPIGGDRLEHQSKVFKSSSSIQV